MEKSKPRSQDVRAITGDNLKKAREAMENYLQFFQKGMSATPWANSELNKKMIGYVHDNISAAFDFAERLTKAENVPEVMSIQTELFQHQLKSLTDQAKDLVNAATKTVSNATDDSSSSIS